MTDPAEMQDRMEQALQRWRARGTPGPWEEKWDGEGGAFVIGNRQVVANMMGADDHKANAGLVAAAPYMAARIEALKAERDRLRAERHPRVEELEEHIANMLEMQECACGYDDPMDVCLGHATILKRIEALKTENGRMRAALEMVHADCIARSKKLPDGDFRVPVGASVWIAVCAALKGEGE